MPDSSGRLSLSFANKNRLRIGLISDTHEAENPADLIATLASQKCDLYVHLGDIGGSRLASKLVREFKQTLGNLDHLSQSERGRFEDLRMQGMPPMWAYIETKLGADSEAREKRAAEARESYLEVLRAMNMLSNVIMVSGNIDNSLLRTHVLGSDMNEECPRLVSEPELLDLGSRAIIVWPSIKNPSPAIAARVHDLLDSFTQSVRGKEQVIVFAHEQIYKGPSPARYKENVEAAGLQATTVPRYEPNPCWRKLLHLFRSLKPSQDAAMVYGHVHDPHQVIQAGAPYLKGSSSQGLRYRLHGLGSKEATQAPGRNGRRTVRLFTIPADAVCVLHLTPRRMRLETVYAGSRGC